MKPPEGEGTRKAYEEWYGEVVRLRDEELRASTWYGHVRAFLPAPRRGWTLEVASGIAAYARERAVRERVVAVDFSLRALREATRRASGRKRFYPVVADAQALPFRDGTFETLISCETIEHLERPEVFLDELYRVGRCGGVLVLTFPSYLNLVGLYRLYLIMRGRPYASGVGYQPRENFLVWPLVLVWLRRSGFRFRGFRGRVHLLPLPRRPMLHVKFLDRIPLLRAAVQPLALHVGFLASKK